MSRSVVVMRETTRAAVILAMLGVVLAGRAPDRVVDVVFQTGVGLALVSVATLYFEILTGRIHS